MVSIFKTIMPESA